MNRLVSALAAGLVHPEATATAHFTAVNGSPPRLRIDIHRFQPGPMVGVDGRMKLAIQTILTGGDPDGVHILFCGGEVLPARFETPQRAICSESLSCFIERLGDYLGRFALRPETVIERTKSAMLVMVRFPETAPRSLRPACAAIIRGIGKAHGVAVASNIEYGDTMPTP